MRSKVSQIVRFHDISSAAYEKPMKSHITRLRIHRSVPKATKEAEKRVERESFFFFLLCFTFFFLDFFPDSFVHPFIVVFYSHSLEL